MDVNMDTKRLVDDASSRDGLCWCNPDVDVDEVK